MFIRGEKFSWQWVFLNQYLPKKFNKNFPPDSNLRCLPIPCIYSMEIGIMQEGRLPNMARITYTGCSGSNWHTLNRFYGRLNGFLGYSLVPIMFTTLWHFVFYLTFPKKVQRGAQIELLKNTKNLKKNFHFFCSKIPFYVILKQNKR